MPSSTRDLTKLPKWAQDRIAVLERDVEDLKAKLSVGPENSDTFVDPHYPDGGRPLGTGALIRFRLKPEEEGWEAYIDARLDEDHRGRRFLLVRAGRSLVIDPTSSNVIMVRSERY